MGSFLIYLKRQAEPVGQVNKAITILQIYTFVLKYQILYPFLLCHSNTKSNRVQMDFSFVSALNVK